MKYRTTEAGAFEAAVIFALLSLGQGRSPSRKRADAEEIGHFLCGYLRPRNVSTEEVEAALKSLTSKGLVETA